MCGVVLFIKYQNTPQFMATFILNGADEIQFDNLTCPKSIKGCFVTMPDIVRNDGEVVGFSIDKNDTSVLYNIGEKVLLELDYIENNIASCKAFNEETSCIVKLPHFNKKGYVNVGYSTSSNEINPALIEYFIGGEYLVDENKKLYPKYDDLRSESSKSHLVYNVNYCGIIKGMILETDKDCNDSIVLEYQKHLEEIYKYMPFLFTNVKITLF